MEGASSSWKASTEDEEDLAQQWLHGAGDEDASLVDDVSTESSTTPPEEGSSWSVWSSPAGSYAGSGTEVSWFGLGDDGGGAEFSGQPVVPGFLDTDYTEEVAGSVPAPLAPASVPAVRAAKRQRQQLPPAIKAQPQHPAPTRTSNVAGDVSRWMEAQLSCEKAWALLSAPAVKCSGARPHHLLETPKDVDGLVFKEPDRGRRMKGTDTWAASGGPKGSSVERVAPGVRVRRKYGKLSVQGHATGGTSERRQLYSFSYHEFSVELEPAASANVVAFSKARLFHILPDKGDGHRLHAVTESQQRRQRQRQQPQQQPRQPRRPTASTGGHVVEGLLTLQTDPVVPAPGVRGESARPRWIRFDDHNGEEQGSIEMEESGSGVVLRSGSGDFAEWHPRLHKEERCFEEGDVVGFYPSQTGI